MKKLLTVVIMLMVFAASAVALECEINGDWDKFVFKENGKKLATWTYYSFGLVKEGKSISGTAKAIAKEGDEIITSDFIIIDNKIDDREYKFRYENGTFFAIGEYVGDMKKGVWTYFHTTGKKAMEGIYKKNMREGYWAFYDKKGYKTEAVYFERDNYDMENETDLFGWVKEKLMHLGEIKR